jgi:hypothetical protein
MASCNVLIAGCGALGSGVAHALARPNVHLFLLDDDVVEENNVFVSQYSNKHLAMSKADALAQIASDRGAEVTPLKITLVSPEQLKNLDIDLVVDCFDNPQARNITGKTEMDTLHVGVGKEGNGVVLWDDNYPMPPITYNRGEEPNPICTNQLGATLLRRTSLRASEVINHWISTGEKINDLTHGGIK